MHTQSGIGRFLINKQPSLPLNFLYKRYHSDKIDLKINSNVTLILSSLSTLSLCRKIRYK